MPKDLYLPVTVGGIEFKNPFIVASGPTTKSVKQMVAIEKAGWAAASIKLNLAPYPYLSRRSRFGVFEDRNALAFTVEKRLTFEQGLKLMEDSKKVTSELILLANMTYSGDEGVPGWVQMAKDYENAGADAIELNMCCPNMSFNLQLTAGNTGTSKQQTGASMGQNANVVADVVKAIKAAVKIPVFVKLTPEGGKIADVSKACYEAGADACGGTANQDVLDPMLIEGRDQSNQVVGWPVRRCHRRPLPPRRAWRQPRPAIPVPPLWSRCGAHPRGRSRRHRSAGARLAAHLPTPRQ